MGFPAWDNDKAEHYYPGKIRFWRSTLVQAIGAPLVFMLLLFILQQADYANQSVTIKNPPSVALEGLIGCSGPTPCINIMFAPNEETYRGYLDAFAKKNAERTREPVFQFEAPITDFSRPKETLGMVPVESGAFLYNYVLKNQNVTNWGITFNQERDVNGNLNVQYQVWFNISRIAVGIDVFGSQLQSFMRGMDEAIISVLNDPTATVTANMDIRVKDWPTVPPKRLADTVVQQLGPVFFFCCVMVIFINALSIVLREKESKLRQGMEVMGLKPSVYWVSEFLSNTVLVTIGSLMTCILGIAFGFAVFRKSDFLAVFITFFLFGESMVVFAFFISTFFKKAQSGVYVGIFVFIIGLLFESFVFSSGYIGYLWWKPSAPLALSYFLSIFPFFNFGKLFLDISTLTTGQLDLITNSYIPGEGLPWSNMTLPIPKNLLPTYGDSTQPIVPTPIQSVYWLLFDILFYAVLTWYFDSVIPNDHGACKHPLFFADPAYWGYESKSTTAEDSEWLSLLKRDPPALPYQIDEDVNKERELALLHDHWPDVKVVHLRKEFKTWKGENLKTAVYDTCITFERGKLVALLGQNGAGKSTTINILSGLSPPTHGDAKIFGFSLLTEMHKIRKLMGVCPQHDILFHELTAREHIELYAGLKGIDSSSWDSIVNERLGAVRLLKVVDNPVGTYSGGMKRRLSVVIASIGDPKIVFLDEPTTGMDPVNRRHVWAFIEKFKKDRVIILTTHSMEEADVLGDRIAIMSRGRIRALGDSATLKTKFGAGYKLSIISAPHKLKRTKDVIGRLIPPARLEDDSAGALLYQFPYSALSFVPELVKSLNLDPYVKAWAISQTTLEQVFLSVIRNSNYKESPKNVVLLEHNGKDVQGNKLDGTIGVETLINHKM